MSFAAPIARDGFLYNGDLFAEVGDLNRHKRASIPEITAVLRPDLKQSKATALQTKDPVWHWYEAQLIHYGLQPSKNKAVAKVRLLEALNKGTLHIPPAIARLEEGLSKEFNAADKKARAQHKASLAEGPTKGSTPRGTSTTTTSKKRKNSDSVNVNVNVVVSSFMQQGQYVGISEPTTGGSSAKKPKTSPTKTPIANVPSVTAPPRITGPKTTVSKTSKPAKGKGLTTKPQTAKRLIAESSTHAQKGLIVKKEPAAKLLASATPTMKPEPKAKKELMKREPTIKKETSSKKPATVKKESPPKAPKIKTESLATPTNFPASPPTKIPLANTVLGLLNGHYTISCPAIDSNWSVDSLSLILTLDTPRIWGAYSFGPFSGIILLPQRPFSPPETIWFLWRGRENGEGQMTFGDDCRGYLTFLGDGRIKGSMNLYGECEFWGQRDGVGVRPARSMKEEWDGYCEEQYERERVGRWGGRWGGW